MKAWQKNTAICAAAVAVLLPSSNSPAGPSISIAHKLEFENQITQLTIKHVTKYFQQAPFNPDQAPIVYTDVIFDQSRLQKNFAEHVEKVQAERERHLGDMQKQIKNFLGENGTATRQDISTALEASKTAPDGSTQHPIEAPPSTLRFGELNLDIDDAIVNRLIDRELELRQQGGYEGRSDSRQPIVNNRTLSLVLGEQSQDYMEGFVFSPEQYVESISITVMVDPTTPEDLIKDLPERLHRELGLAALTNQKPAQAVTVNPLPAKPIDQTAASTIPEAPDTFGSLVGALLNPSNGLLGSLAGATILGLLFLMAAIVLRSSFKTIAKGISELKPTENSDTITQATDEFEGGEPAEHRKVKADTVDSSTNDHSAENIAVLTSEMSTIRQQIANQVSLAPQISAEILSDVLYGAQGYQDLRNMLAFVGYNHLKVAFDLLPTSVLESITAYMEDQRNSPPSLVAGVEAGQRFYQDLVAKTASKSALSKEVAGFRDYMVGVSDAALISTAQKCSDDELAFLLNTLTVQRGNVVMKSLTGEALKGAIANIDKHFSEENLPLAELRQKLQECEASLQGKDSDKRVRFILRMCANASLEDEKKVLAIVSNRDFDLRRKMMEKKVFYKDMRLFAPEDLRSCLDSFPYAFKGELIFVAEHKLKKILLSSYKEGSKLREMLDEELKLIEKNDQKAKAIKARRDEIISAFTKEFRARVSAHPEFIDRAIENLKLEASSSKEDLDQESDQQAA